MAKFKYEIEIESKLEKLQKQFEMAIREDIVELFEGFLRYTFTPYAYKKFNELYRLDKSSGRIIKKDIIEPLARIPFSNPCAISTKSLPGVYLLLQANLNYDTNEMLYTCKIGTSKNIAKRIEQYHTYNTGFYHNDMSIVILDDKKREDFEISAQNGLIKMGFNKVCGKSAEWFLINKELFEAMRKNGVEIMKRLAEM